jgi:hypothetical protein
VRFRGARAARPAGRRSSPAGLGSRRRAAAGRPGAAQIGGRGRVVEVLTASLFRSNRPQASAPQLPALAPVPHAAARPSPLAPSPRQDRTPAVPTPSTARDTAAMLIKTTALPTGLSRALPARSARAVAARAANGDKASAGAAVARGDLARRARRRAAGARKRPARAHAARQALDGAAGAATCRGRGRGLRGYAAACACAHATSQHRLTRSASPRPPRPALTPVPHPRPHLAARGRRRGPCRRRGAPERAHPRCRRGVGRHLHGEARAPLHSAARGPPPAAGAPPPPLQTAPRAERRGARPASRARLPGISAHTASAAQRTHQPLSPPQELKSISGGGSLLEKYQVRRPPRAAWGRPNALCAAPAVPPPVEARTSRR